MSAMKSFHDSAGLRANSQKSQVVFGGTSDEMIQQCLRITGLQATQFPLKYLGVPITASRLTKVECNTLVEKITGRIHIWATRNISFAGRAVLINSVIFGMFNYWASISSSQMPFWTNSLGYAGTTYSQDPQTTEGLPTFSGTQHVALRVRGSRDQRFHSLEQGNHS